MKKEKKLGFLDLMSISIGQITGSGIMVLTGVSIGLTGYGTPWAFIVGAIITLFPVICIAALGSAVPSNGGMYTYVRDYIGKKTGLFYVVLLVTGQLVIAVYALSFAEYLSSLVAVNLKVVAAIVMTLCFAINIVGIRMAAKLQTVLVICLLAALGLFSIYGLPQVTDIKPFFEMESIMPNGLVQFFVASALLRFAMVGSEYISELGSETKNPGKLIPFVMIFSTLVVAVFYFVLGVVAAGVLPIEEVAFQPLTLVAKKILPNPIFVFFIIGGALANFFSSLNGVFSWCTRGLAMAIDDGWFPKALAKRNKTFGTQHYLLLIFYIVGMLPIVTDMDITYISMLGNGVGMIFGIIPAFALFFLVKKNPEAYQKAAFKLPVPLTKILPVISLILFSYGSYLSFGDLNQTGWIILGAFLILVIVYANVKGKSIEIQKSDKVNLDEIND
ncbi:APA family basic amino acid/polyamine antiporter [Enterococcus sp. PF1-24]|uniref:APC family permease n=1 Tax=unclassified Enterococcus TaxID=2608891 RepID=UPI0024750B63|nr:MULTISPECIES: APC family permease [unclassified Enterococcus]MDH6363952.1 APA family basic amino acid/polyamine antiporter [Enterococcus sp. PFB1-1]MDH6401053.1 APA family basic amino acid/polyamine antiporter [Enterococcus sp. PF1-24]